MKMITRGASMKLAGAIVTLALLGGAIVAFTQRNSPPVTRVRVCVNDNGQLRMLTGTRTTCDPPEQAMDWVVGGEVTDIQAGRGLVSSREGGAVQLELAPSIIAGCTGCQGGKVFAGFNDGPGQIPFFTPGTIAELDLPAGDYVIFAKLIVEQPSSPGGYEHAVPVGCKLTAGNDFDVANGVLNIHPLSYSYLDGSNITELTLQVVHSFSEPGSVVLSGSHASLAPSVRYRNLKIIAIEASSISNVFLGGN